MNLLGSGKNVRMNKMEKPAVKNLDIPTPKNRKKRRSTIVASLHRGVELFFQPNSLNRGSQLRNLDFDQPTPIRILLSTYGTGIALR